MSSYLYESLKPYTPSMTLYGPLKWLTAILPNLCHKPHEHITYTPAMAHACGVDTRLIEIVKAV